VVTLPPKNDSHVRKHGLRLSGKLVFVLALVAGLGLFLLLRPSPPLPVLTPVALLTNGFPAYKPTLFERYVPLNRGWAWLWKLRGLVVGTPRPINLSVTILSCSDLPPLPAGPPEYAGTNGLRVWFVSDADLVALRNQLLQMPGAQIIAQPRISTSSGVECALQIGSLNARFLGHVHSEKLDLYTRLVDAEPGGQEGGISTNIDLALRFQVPTTKSVFLLNKDARDHQTAVHISLKPAASRK
jgi:hypothetical protein